MGVPRTEAGFLLVLAGRTFREAAESALREKGQSLRALSALGHLKARPDSSYSDLARRAGVTPQSMQATLATLETDGLVARGDDSTRGRAAQLRVTSRGARQLAAGQRAVAAAHESLLQQLSPKRREALTELLQSLLRLPESRTRGTSPYAESSSQLTSRTFTHR